MPKENKFNVISLMTNRNSNNVQIKTISKALANGGNIYESNVHMNIFSKLPNFILMFLPVWLIVNKNDGFNDIDHCDIIVSCGRRTLKYAKHLKKNMFPEAKIVQILKPDYFANDIDMILLPKHDRVRTKKNDGKIIRFKGALSEKISDEELSKSKEKLENEFKKKGLKPPYIGVYIGGSSRHFVFTRGMATELTRRINAISKEMGVTMLVTTSRRTKKKTADTIKRHLDCPHYFYEFKENKSLDKEDENPYKGYLAMASYNIITGDSISMISEVLSMEKPVYVFTEGIKTGKYGRFINDLLNSGDIRELTRVTTLLEDYHPNATNNVNYIAGEVLNQIGLMNLN